MRISKKHDVRLGEILDAAETLFVQKGYEKTTVNDILEKVEIGKGTFYHYYKSKEDVMNAVIERLTDRAVAAAQKAAADEGLGAHEKFCRIILSLNVGDSADGGMIEELHRPSNAQMHQKSTAETIRASAPILADVVKQGVKEGVYNTCYPLETVEFLLAANQAIFDSGIFRWTPDQMFARAEAFAKIVERSLGAADGSFDFLLDLIVPNGERGEHGER